MNRKILLFDLELYDYQTIRTAAQEYRQLADIKINHDGQIAQCEFTKCAYDSELTTLEFANYVLGLTAQKGGHHVLG